MKFDRDILTKDQLLLYAVTDSHWLNGRTLHSVVKESLEGGVTFVQLREKQLDEAHFMEEAKDLQVLCREYNVPFIIKDNVDIALAMDADGVHVGQSDMEADGNNRNGYRFTDCFQCLMRHLCGIILGTGREYRTDSQIICPMLFCQNRLLYCLS